MENRRVRFYAFGRPAEVLQVERQHRERPAYGEVSVRMLASPINPSDLIPVTGAYAHRIALPGVPGYEGVGVVEDVGPGVVQDLLGKRVLPLRGEGTWQEYVRAPAEWVVSVPAEIDDDTAAQAYINPVTAWVICTGVLQLKPDDIVLVNACGSAIGRIFAQLAKHMGFRLIAVTRNGVHTEELLRLGAWRVVDTAVSPLQQTVRELSQGMGAKAAIDSVGGAAGTELAFCLQPHGVFLALGLLSGIPVDWASIAGRGDIAVSMFHLRHWNERVSVETWQETFHRVWSLMRDGAVKMNKPKARFDLADVQQAVRLAEAGGVGKVLLTGASLANR
ncbi:zinc-dependent alcohol dehydrogenase family protein [Brevibacillus sp. TJ4]|uniref:zinc-dependent alcohol dehydrogenase family protein n=1 Tax=Brevibacillus sp. TJ4 TaxID=3234853 RepID=UPI003BA2FF5A